MVIEYGTRNFQAGSSNLTAGHLQTTLSKLLTSCVLRSTQPPTLSEMEMSSSLELRGEGVVWRSSHLPARKSDFHEITEVSVSRDL